MKRVSFIIIKFSLITVGIILSLFSLVAIFTVSVTIGIPMLLLSLWIASRGTKLDSYFAKEKNTNMLEETGNKKSENISEHKTKQQYSPPTVKERDWVISVSFGESTSKNFERAIYLANKSDYFSNYTTEEGTLVYQADFKSDNFLNYLDLFHVVSSWKSSFVFINGKRVDKKTLSTINRCYGDKIAFMDDYFCYGASIFTKNPFGCHRLMITPSQRDWMSYSIQKGDYLIIDKPSIAREIINQSKKVELCPSFNLEKSLLEVEKLPDKIEITSNFLK